VVVHLPDQALVGGADGADAGVVLEAPGDFLVLGWLVLFGFTAALFYHAANGVRHLVWDAGYGFGKETARQSGIAVFAVAGGLTVLFWLLVLIVA
jgi:succinate dehydrogenase/fumarate reductase cytochrome b subunit